MPDGSTRSRPEDSMPAPSLHPKPVRTSDTDDLREDLRNALKDAPPSTMTAVIKVFDRLAEERDLVSSEVGKTPVLPVESPEKPRRGKRLEVRLSEIALDLIKRAAELTGFSLSDYVVQSASAKAKLDLEEHTTIRLNAEEQKRFVELLLNPPKSDPAIERARASHKRLIRRSEA
jgi:uncharacterized protein (DUF1778 family)